MHQTHAPKRDSMTLTISVGLPSRRKAKNTATRSFGDKRTKRLKTRRARFCAATKE